MSGIGPAELIAMLAFIPAWSARRAQGVFAAGFWDGRGRMSAADVAPEVFRAIVTPSGGETVRLD